MAEIKKKKKKKNCNKNIWEEFKEYPELWDK